VAADAQAAIVLTIQALLARAAPQLEQAPTLRQLHWLATDAPLPPGAPDSWREPQPDDLAALLYTSGSTSGPKGVMLSQRALQGAPLALPPGWDPDGTVTGVSWMPLYHVSGLNSVLMALRAAKATVVWLPAEPVLEEPVRWLRAISRYRAVHARGPNFLYQLCADRVAPEDGAGLDLSTWLFARCSAEPVHPETVEQFITAFAPHGFRPDAFHPAYGLSEHPEVSGSTRDRAPALRAFDRAALAQNRVSAVDRAAPDALRLVGNGRPGPGVVVRIVDPSTARHCPADQVGEVWVAGEYLAAGYWGRPEATTETFQARTAGSGEGPFLRTGDLGFLYEGELYICGRLKDVIIVRGQNYYARTLRPPPPGACWATIPTCCAPLPPTPASPWPTCP
jgi:acyl-CoA synthetase (AMP-forming)/AMP-acid ligase II